MISVFFLLFFFGCLLVILFFCFFFFFLAIFFKVPFLHFFPFPKFNFGQMFFKYSFFFCFFTFLYSFNFPPSPFFWVFFFFLFFFFFFQCLIFPCSLPPQYSTKFICLFFCVFNSKFLCLFFCFCFKILFVFFLYVFMPVFLPIPLFPFVYYKVPIVFFFVYICPQGVPNLVCRSVSFQFRFCEVAPPSDGVWFAFFNVFSIRVFCLCAPPTGSCGLFIFQILNVPCVFAPFFLFYPEKFVVFQFSPL